MPTNDVTSIYITSVQSPSAATIHLFHRTVCHYMLSPCMVYDVKIHLILTSQNGKLCSCSSGPLHHYNPSERRSNWVSTRHIRQLSLSVCSALVCVATPSGVGYCTACATWWLHNQYKTRTTCRPRTHTTTTAAI